jgi:hypothetical protein
LISRDGRAIQCVLPFFIPERRVVKGMMVAKQIWFCSSTNGFCSIMAHTGAGYLRSLGGEPSALQQRFRFALLFASDMGVEAQGNVERLSTGEWHHVCGVYNGATASVYVNCKQNDCNPVGTVNISPENQAVNAANAVGNFRFFFLDSILVSLFILFLYIVSMWWWRLFGKTLFAERKQWIHWIFGRKL